MAVPLLNGVDHCHLNVDDLAQCDMVSRCVGFLWYQSLRFGMRKGSLTLKIKQKQFVSRYLKTGNSKGIAFSVSGAISSMAFASIKVRY